MWAYLRLRDGTAAANRAVAMTEPEPRRLKATVLGVGPSREPDGAEAQPATPVRLKFTCPHCGGRLRVEPQEVHAS